MKLSKSRNLKLPPIPIPSSAEANIKDLVEKSAVQWIRNNKQLSFIGNNGLVYRLLEEAIQAIELTNIGKDLLGRIESTCRRKSEELIIHLNSSKFAVDPLRASDAHNHKGSGSNFYCNLTKLDSLYESGITRPQRYACMVFHELLHVLHNLNGEHGEHPLGIRPCPIPGALVDSTALLEEARTVGLGRFSNEILSENKFRAELGVPRRTVYQHESAAIYDDNTVIKGVEKREPLYSDILVVSSEKYD
ncbi:M91 family zinc metallopeptidase [Xenorhabdus innexi]|uniref:T3SS effector protein NleD n=1 Tax=Xenorhabdus innexi TaxID=290109 RepID=A0A1N6MVY7_9GAMM|nr:M91 family zinc metallopeptidase [Xenorhabdus innexi]PHM35775.1 T3SS effector protein NleD [Xenorhabdus innexi]SIP72947.1 T3SS effector protein NleD [Xenorhabdus innexi]